jgi:hypothetical protein
LDQLSAAFGEWRRGKRHLREKMPAELLGRARRAAKRYGFYRVARAVRMDRQRLEGSQTAPSGGKGTTRPPAYSRVELVGAAPAARPFAELEMPSGIKLRLYAGTPGTMGLLSAVCGSGGGR